MLAFKLAFKNLWGAKLRTFLNTIVLSFAFVVIIFHNGIIDGWNLQARNDTIDWEIGEGQLWHPEYDPLDFLSYQDAHAPISEALQTGVAAGELTPILLTQASAFPEGRMQGVVLKGIDPDQNIIDLPTELLKGAEEGVIPALIGKRMANTIKTQEGDNLLIRWRDSNGTYDALEISIVGVFDCDVPTVDVGMIWLPLEQLRTMLTMPNEATLLVANESFAQADMEGWEFKDQKFLLKDLNMIIQSKKGGGVIMYGLLLVIALLAIFDTQVLSIFRRQKEIGTYIALGLTRWQVVRMFTVEGATYSILAVLLGALYGGPLLYYLNKVGWTLPQGTSDMMSVAAADTIYPAFGIGLILGTVLIVVITATIVSFLPARKIAKLSPTDALKGKIQ